MMSRIFDLIQRENNVTNVIIIIPFFIIIGVNLIWMLGGQCTINTNGKLCTFQTIPARSNEFILPKLLSPDLCSNGLLYDRYISLCQRFFKVRNLVVFNCINIGFLNLDYTYRLQSH